MMSSEELLAANSEWEGTAAITAASDLLSEWSSLFGAGAPLNDGTAAEPLPDAVQLYRLGVLLSQLPTTAAVPSASSSAAAVAAVREASHGLLVALPDRHRSAAFRDLQRALLMALSPSDGEEEGSEDIIQSAAEEGLTALAQLYAAASDAAPSAADWMAEGDDLERLLGAYPLIGGSVGRRSLLALLSRVLWTGSSPDDLTRIVQAAAEGGGAWHDFVEWQDGLNDQWRHRLLSHYFGEFDGEGYDPVLRDYAAGLLRASPSDEQQSEAIRWDAPSISRQKTPASGTALATRDAAKRELQRRIDRIQQVLPHLGGGFVEAALSYFHGDVEQTLTALLEDNDQEGRGGALPEALRVLDRSLPRRRAEAPGDGASLDDLPSDGAARAWTRAAVLATVARNEAEASAVDRVLRASASSTPAPRNEYDDDYNDQYDDAEPFVADDQTYDAVLMYNRVLKDVEGDRRFWDEQRNTNRATPRHSSGGRSDGDDEERPRYRGPDKLRGGRVPRPVTFAGRGGPGRAPKAGQDAGGRGGRNEKSRFNEPQSQTEPGEGSDGRGRGNVRHKAAVMARRRDKQKQASAKRAG